MLAHLAYVSTRKSNCTEIEIDKILQACKKNNPPLMITGVLLYTDKKFIQYVEGEYNQIIGLYDKIKKDGRHENVVMVSVGPITSKIFPGWHMGSQKVSGEGIEYRTDIGEDDKKMFQSILGGQQEDGARVRDIMQKIFKN